MFCILYICCIFLVFINYYNVPKIKINVYECSLIAHNKCEWCDMKGCDSVQSSGNIGENPNVKGRPLGTNGYRYNSEVRRSGNTKNTGKSSCGE